MDVGPIFSGSVRGVRFGFGQSGIGGWYCCRAVSHQNVRSGSRHGVVVDDSLDVDQKWQSFLANEGWKISKEIYSTLEATTNLLDTADGTHAKWSSDGQLGLLLVFDSEEADELIGAYFAGMDGSDGAQSSFGCWVAGLMGMLDACLTEFPPEG